jgi:hypothetical protein
MYNRTSRYFHYDVCIIDIFLIGTRLASTLQVCLLRASVRTGALLDAITDNLGIKVGETTKRDNMFTLVEVSKCALSIVNTPFSCK